jgi:hypothetical protein
VFTGENTTVLAEKWVKVGEGRKGGRGGGGKGGKGGRGGRGKEGRKGWKGGGLAVSSSEKVGLNENNYQIIINPSTAVDHFSLKRVWVCLTLHLEM